VTAGERAADGPARWSRIGPPQLLLLGSATAVLPLTIDLYLPALPTIAADLGAGPFGLQLSLTATVVGVAVGQLVVGTLSDRVGRRAPLLGGFLGYVVASAACALAPTLPAFLAGRFLQGLFASAGIAVTLAVLRDHVSGPALSRGVARLLLVRGAGPILAPPLGALVLVVTGWRGLFVLLAGFGLLVLGALFRSLPESLPREQRRAVPAAAIARTYAELAVDRSFVFPGLVSALGFAAMFAWLAAGSFVLQGPYGLSELEYGLVFALAAACVIVTAQVVPAIADRTGVLRLLRLSPLLGVGAAGTLAVLAAVGAAPLAVAVGLVMVTFVAVGATLTLAPSVALSGQPPARAGQASGLLGVLQFTLGGVAGPLVGVLGTGSAFGMAVVMAATFALAAVMGALSRT
jgi:DHA1 family bicyclomycin/chloramphenicol resistance-like MFS transporter